MHYQFTTLYYNSCKIYTQSVTPVRILYSEGQRVRVYTNESACMDWTGVLDLSVHFTSQTLVQYIYIYIYIYMYSSRRSG